MAWKNIESRRSLMEENEAVVLNTSCDGLDTEKATTCDFLSMNSTTVKHWIAGRLIGQRKHSSFSHWVF
jgi:hypothetical protein